MKSKIAYHLTKGDKIYDGKTKAIVEQVIKRDQDRYLEVTVRLPKEEGKRVLHFKWNEDVSLVAPPSKRMRKAFIKWIANKLGVVVKIG